MKKVIFIFLLILMIFFYSSFITEEIQVEELTILSMPKATRLLYKDESINIPKGIIDMEIGDLEGDGYLDVAFIFKENFSNFGGEVRFYSLEENLKECFNRNLKDINLWKVRFGDIEGDGEKEVSFGVFKKSPFHQIYGKRLFFYNLDKDKKMIFPKFRASRLSEPFYDFEFFNDGEKDLVIALENTKEGLKIKGYTWAGFGFFVSHISDEVDGRFLDKRNGEIFIDEKIFCPEKELRRLE